MLAGATGIDFALLVVVGRRRRHAADRRASADHRPARPRPRHRRADQGRPRRRRPAARAHGRDRDAARRDLAQGRGDRAGLGADRRRASTSSKAKLLALGESGKGATGFARLAVDRCFTLPGAGVVVTGTVLAGEITVGDRLLLTPSGLEARVRSLHAQNRAGRGRPRRRALRAQSRRRRARRTPSGAATGWSSPSCTRRPTGSTCGSSLLASEGQPLKHWSPVHLHLGAAHVMGRVALLEGDKLAPGRHGAGPARARGEDRRACGRPLHPARSLGHPHDGGRRRDRSLRPAAQPPLGAPAGRARGPAPSPIPTCCPSCCGWTRASSRPAASAWRATCGRSTSTSCCRRPGGAKLEGFGFLAETLAAARKDIVDTLKAHHAGQARCARPAARAAAARLEEALAARRVQGAARPRGQGQGGDGRRRRSCACPAIR